MWAAMKAIVLLFISALPAAAQQATPGLESAALLGGWPMANGHRMVALELRLQPGWKTYWRSPGDTGIPPSFDWSGSENLGEVTIHWPRPEVIESAGETTFGYHDTLILPIEVAPRDPGQAVDIRGQVDFGLCQDICVPARAELQMAPAGRFQDPRILQALDDVPRIAATPAQCRIEEIADGMRVTATLPALPALKIAPAPAPAPAVAMELARAGIWVSQPETTLRDGEVVATSDFIDATGKPFALDPAQLRLTLIAGAAAVEFSGCQPEG